MKISIFYQCLAFFVYLTLMMGIRISLVFINDLTENGIIQANKTIELEKRVIDTEKNYELLKNYINENSGIPNEKRKAIFELKVQQDSVLIDLLLNDIRTNKEILKLLDTDWVYNDSTEFKTLKIK